MQAMKNLGKKDRATPPAWIGAKNCETWGAWYAGSVYFNLETKMLTNATFKIVSWDEEPFDEPEDGPKLTRAHIKKVFPR